MDNNRSRASRQKLVAAIRTALESKQNIQEQIPGALGTYDTSGNKIIKVPGRPDFVYVRIRGQVSELIEAFNDKVYLQWGLPVLLLRDPLSPRYYKIVGRDVGKYQGWDSAGLPEHGDQHSFSSSTIDGRDITFIYRRQLVQPLLCRPQTDPNMTVFVEADYYYWNGTYVRFTGGSSSDMTSLRPTTASFFVFVVVYLDGGTNTIQLLRGTEFNAAFPPANKIPVLDSSIGIPLAAVLLTSATVKINWDIIYDIRVLIFTSSNIFPAQHALDPALGSHSGSLPATDVSIVDSRNYFTGANAEVALQEIGKIIEHGKFKGIYPSGTMQITLLDDVHFLDAVFLNGFLMDYDYATITGALPRRNLLKFAYPLGSSGIISVDYSQERL